MPIRISPADDAERDARDQLARIARELRMARLRHGISQGEVARRLSVSISRVSRAERAAVAPTVVDLVRHAAAVGLPHAYGRLSAGPRAARRSPARAAPRAAGSDR